MQTTTTPAAPIALAHDGGPLRITLVYQAGIANVFQVTHHDLSRDARGPVRRLYQGDYRTAESICYGAGLAGAIVRTLHCNRAGDIADQPWTAEIGPFGDQHRPQVWN